jgi:hypothetical protein
MEIVAQSPWAAAAAITAENEHYLARGVIRGILSGGVVTAMQERGGFKPWLPLGPALFWRTACASGAGSSSGGVRLGRSARPTCFRS